MSNYRAPAPRPPVPPEELVRQLLRLDDLQWAREPGQRAEYDRLRTEVELDLERDPSVQLRPRFVRSEMHRRRYRELAEHLKTFHAIEDPKPPPAESDPLFVRASQWRIAAFISLALVFGVPFNIVAAMTAHSARAYARRGNFQRADKNLRTARIMTVLAFLWTPVGLLAILLDK